jgi:hypothetical protein
MYDKTYKATQIQVDMYDDCHTLFIFKCSFNYSLKALFILFKNPKFKNSKMTNPSAPIKAVSSQRSEEIEPKAGIAIAERQEQFAPNYSIGIQFI